MNARSWFARHQVLLIVTALGVVVVPGYVVLDNAVDKAQDAAETAQAAIDAVEDSRAEASIAGCEFAVDTAERINGLNDRTQDLLRSVLAGSTTAQAAEFIEVQIGLYEAVKVPYRDCSPEGIAAFVDTGGVAGFLPPGSPPP